MLHGAYFCISRICQWAPILDRLLCNAIDLPLLAFVLVCWFYILLAADLGQDSFVLLNLIFRITKHAS